MSDHEPAPSSDVPNTRPLGDSSAEISQKRARQALDEAFSDFYRANLSKLIGFLLNQGASLYDATDIAQETMTRAYRDWTTLTHPRAWIHTVASRALIRKVSDIREIPAATQLEPTSLLPDLDAVEAWEAEQDWLRRIASLPPRQRQIMAWTLAEFTPSEIAAHVSGLTSDAVRASLKKARHTLAPYRGEGGEAQ